MNIKRVRLDAMLPPTPCTPDMRSLVVDVAKLLGVSIAEVQRAAVTLFLSQSESISTENESISTEKVVS